MFLAPSPDFPALLGALLQPLMTGGNTKVTKPPPLSMFYLPGVWQQSWRRHWAALEAEGWRQKSCWPTWWAWCCSTARARAFRHSWGLWGHQKGWSEGGPDCRQEWGEASWGGSWARQGKGCTGNRRPQSLPVHLRALWLGGKVQHKMHLMPRVMGWG